MRIDSSRLRARWRVFSNSKWGKRLLTATRYLFWAGIVGYLGYELTHIGWGEIWQALPTHPLFYAIFLLLYFSLPLAKLVIYRLTWQFDLWEGFKAFVKKRVYNKDVLGYSGEVYLFSWARTHIGQSDREVAKTIRDQNIVSSAASTLVAVLMLLVFLYAGEISVAAWLGHVSGWYALAGGIAALVVGGLAFRFRKYIFAMALKTALLIFAIHCVRLVIGQGLQIAQWSVAMPEVSLYVWFTYAAASIIVSRLPFVPNRDLIFLAAGVELAGHTQISSAGVAGMLMVNTVLGKVLNLALFALITAVNQWRDDAASPPDKEAVSTPEAALSAPESSEAASPVDA